VAVPAGQSVDEGPEADALDDTVDIDAPPRRGERQRDRH